MAGSKEIIAAIEDAIISELSVRTAPWLVYTWHPAIDEPCKRHSYRSALVVDSCHGSTMGKILFMDESIIIIVENDPTYVHEKSCIVSLSDPQLLDKMEIILKASMEYWYGRHGKLFDQIIDEYASKSGLTITCHR